ncbi:translation initiation factor IF-2 [Roridomyces roridus]|uniref:Translation initiation factor IF-2 n=1 Tax=Roridomyces roridus TaxID=1738132 RepID=A0AAD7BW19_9AGAR|nr:translation initiation factor IF-2 [Roridomyces roridus]
MLLALPPTIRRRCSVRSAATAAKPRVSPTANSSLDTEPSIHAQPDRAAALARSKWAPKPNPEGGFPNARASSWGSTSSDPLFPATGTSPATSKWSRTTPQSPIQAWPTKNTARPNPARSRWPSLSETAGTGSTRFDGPNTGTSRWAAQPESSSRPQHELPPHLQWRRPPPEPSPAPAVHRGSRPGIRQRPRDIENVSLWSVTPHFMPPIEEAESRDRTHRAKNTFKKERGSLGNNVLSHLAVQPKTNTQKVKKPWAFVEKRVTKEVYIPSTVSVEQLSKLLGVLLTSDYAVLLAEEYGMKPIVNDEAAFDLYRPHINNICSSPPHPNASTLPNRPPVVTIMGHVDHGKTTLLDTLRSSSVAKGEVGGITQHIGAFSVPVPSPSGSAPQYITFLDTPGHAAFSAIARTWCPAADDGIMPQTREVIELIKKDRDKVGVVVAINKIDKPGCDVDALQKALLVEDIHLEDLGGDTPAVQVSGLTGQGLSDLVETLSLMADIQDLRAERDGKVFGYVLESKVMKGLGPIATVLVLRGSLTPGCHILSGVHHAKVRVMQDSNGQTVKDAPPGMAVTVSGWKSLPSAGDEVLQGTESEIKKAIANRQRKLDVEASMADVEAINNSRHQERERRQAEVEAAGAAVDLKPKEETPSGPKELRLVIKAMFSGSAEAVEGALQGIGNHLAMTKVISTGVGEILETDVMRAKAIGGTVVGFSVPVSRAVETLAAQHDVRIITSDIIYRLMETVKERIVALLPVILEFKVVGEAKHTKTVAGSRVINGIIEKTKQARVVRGGDVIFEGSFETMRHFKKDVTELRQGHRVLQADDIIQAYETIEKPGIL